MNLLLLGATGRVGGHVLRLALQDGHHVTALVRNPDRIPCSHPNLTLLHGNARRPEDISRAVAGAEVVISALGTDGTTTLTDSVRALVPAMEQERIKRIITVGTAGILQSRVDPALLRYQSSESRRRITSAAEEHHRAYQLLSQTALAWTIVCPTALKEEPSPAPVRVQRDYLPENGTWISFADTGAFVYRQINDLTYVQARVGIAY
jgi:putative NADH-flavin reductase